MSDARALAWIKGVHTAIWAVFAGAILAIAPLALSGKTGWAHGLAWLVAAECVVVVVNRMRCPLTDLAARHTAERRANFDIHLPEWLARHNQRIFGALYALDLLLLAWLGWSA